MTGRLQPLQPPVEGSVRLQLERKHVVVVLLSYVVVRSGYSVERGISASSVSLLCRYDT
jgi:hypothetical protein